MLAAWSSWGAIPQIFDESRDDWAAERAELRSLLSDTEWAAASRTTINAHYTDPAIVSAMWTAVGRLGLAEGQVLEPGAGSGTFIGLAPEGLRMTGVELDPTTARIAQALYPAAEIRSESFADTRYPTGSFDAAIGNVPFGNVTLYDKLHNANGHSLHNHFILKSLDFVRPGGVVAVLTSSFTMDSTNPGARREMYAKADLLGAIRLPTGAHRRTAGTEALTDVLILRRREPGQEPGEDSWLTTTPMRIDGELTERRVSRYFTEHPDRVLGQWTVGSGMYGAETLGVRADDLASTSARLSEALDRVVDEAITAGRAVTERPLDLGEAQAIAIAPEHGVWLGMVTAHPVSGFEITEATGAVDLEVPRSQHTELHALLSMRDMGRDLLAAEAASADDTPALDDLRTRLREAYTDYADRYGPINRVRVSVTSRIDPETGEAIVQRRRPPVMKWLRTDPFGSLIRALEVFDETAGTARPADLLTERVVLPRTPVMGVDTPDEALAVAMETDGELELSRVAELLDTTEEDARRQLGTLAFDDPDTGRLVPAAEYLSGNVRTKLDATTAAVDERPELAANVAALRQVLPAALGADEITPRIGAVWITPENHQDFLRQILNDPNARVIYGGGTDWEVKANAGSVAATSEWGTERRSAGDLMRALLEQAQIVVYDVDPVDNSRILNPTESEAAREKADAIQERFADWLWEDPARADRLVAEYNRRFNSLVLRDYTAEGSRLTLPGMVTTWDPWPHQRAAVARMLAEPTVGLFHEVGAGKTTEMVMGAMELRRLGMATKPVVVVPNHMLEQFSREWLQIYPQAQVLAASGDDLKAVNRRDFVARVATGDWDGVVMTRSAFGRLNLSVDAEAAYRTRELEEQRAQLETAKANGANLTVKRIEKKLLQLEEKLDQLTDLPRDPGLSFEDTGIDYLIIDEAHDYKNLRTISSIPDANIDGSGRATDLHMKVDLLRARHGERVLTMATATPIANSITEAHVMTRYLRPDLLDAAGISHFDQWAATFGQTVTELEMAPTGGGRYREKTRFASFTNVPEMLRIWSTFADVQTAEDLKLPTPDIRARPDGQRLPETVIVPPSPELLEFVQSLGARADALSGRAGKGEDNMLSITGDGRRAALDMRLVGHPEPDGPTKVTVAADRIASIWRANRDRTYLDQTGTESPTPGALQIVFCDQSTPKPDRFNVYSELKSHLIDRGLLPRSVRFIHDAANDVEKGRLFAACRSGEVAVLIGSTEKMGVGTNVQARAVALHHLDCPWRPADLAQRDGRILRQGNQNPEIEIIRYTTGKSFDAYSWQTVERKQKFISQVLRGRLDVREIEDIGDSALSLAETKALAADDPLVLEKATIDSQVTKLQRLDRAYHKQQTLLSYRAEQASRTIGRADADEPLIQAAIDRTVSTSGEAFRCHVAGRPFTERTEAARALRVALMSRARRSYEVQETGVRAQLGGQEFTFHQLPSSTERPEWRVQIDGVPRTATTLTADNVADSYGSITILENRTRALPTALDKLRGERAEAVETETAARAGMGQPFKHAAELAAARSEAERINTRIAERAAPPPPPGDPATAAPISEALAEAQEAARLSGLGRSSTGRPTAPARDVSERREWPAAHLPKPQRPGGRSI